MKFSNLKSVFLNTKLPWLLPVLVIWIINALVSLYLRSHVLTLYEGSNLSPWMSSAAWMVVPLVIVALVILISALYHRILGERAEALWPYFRFILILFAFLGVIYFGACFMQLVVDIGAKHADQSVTSVFSLERLPERSFSLR